MRYDKIRAEMNAGGGDWRAELLSSYGDDSDTLLVSRNKTRLAVSDGDSHLPRINFMI
jgi:hypothetical protein